jgi:hypothetical protein
MSHCIVCNKPIPKRTHTWYLREAVEAHEETFKEQMGHRMSNHDFREAKPVGTIDHGHTIHTIYVDQFPKTKEDCARFTNQTVVSVRRHHTGDYISQFSTWDGVSYQDEYFDSGKCAAKQGYAAAQLGHRFTWTK